MKSYKIFIKCNSKEVALIFKKTSSLKQSKLMLNYNYFF